MTVLLHTHTHRFQCLSAYNIINDHSNCAYVCNEIQQSYYAFRLDNATLSDFGTSAQITRNKFLEDGASFQNAFYGTLNNTSDVDYFEDGATGTMGSFTYYHNPISLGINITGGGGGVVLDQFGADIGCSPAPMPRIASSNSFEEKESVWSIYPNPSSGNVYVDLDKSDKANFRVVNLLGQTIWEGTLDNQAPIPASLPSGTYIIERIAQDKVETKKIIIQ